MGVEKYANSNDSEKQGRLYLFFPLVGVNGIS